MPDEIEISNDELDALAGKLDAIGEQLNDREKAALLLVFKLAGDVVADQEPDVEGFGVGARSFAVSRSAAIPSLSQGFQGAFTKGGARGIGVFADADSTTVSGGINVMGTSSAGKFGGSRL